MPDRQGDRQIEPAASEWADRSVSDRPGMLLVLEEVLCLRRNQIYIDGPCLQHRACREPRQNRGTPKHNNTENELTFLILNVTKNVTKDILMRTSSPGCTEHALKSLQLTINGLSCSVGHRSAVMFAAISFSLACQLATCHKCPTLINIFVGIYNTCGNLDFKYS